MQECLYHLVQWIEKIVNNIDNWKLENVTESHQHNQNDKGVHQTSWLRLLVQAFNVDLYIQSSNVGLLQFVRSILSLNTTMEFNIDLARNSSSQQE